MEDCKHENNEQISEYPEYPIKWKCKDCGEIQNITVQ